MKKLIKWFELNWGWMFVNGRKQARYAAYLRKKYGKTEEQSNKSTPVIENKTKGNVKPKTNVKKNGEKPKGQPRNKKS